MSMFDFPEEQHCPSCEKRFSQAELRAEYDPVVVVTCPHCSTMLWRPGSEERTPLVLFDPHADDGGI